MERKRYIGALMILMSALSVFATGCASLRPNAWTQAARADEVIGAYTLILYGSRHAGDVETVAFLDKEGDQYTFEPYAPAFDYQVVKGVPAKEALARAQRFVSWHHSFIRSQLSGIVDATGAVIGYEMRPLYQPFTFGAQDVLDISYRISDNRVIIWVKLLPTVERRIQGDTRPFFDFGMGW